MKKINWFFAIIIAAVLTSCGGHGDPMIFVDGEYDPIKPNLDDVTTVVLKGNVSADEVNLKEVTFRTNYEEDPFVEIIQSVASEEYPFEYTTELLNLVNENGNKAINVTITAKDVDGQTSVKVVDVEWGEEPTTPLEEAEFEWKRVAGAAATGLDEFGLEWTKNAKEVMCIIVPKTGTKLVELTKEVYALETLEELAVEIDNAQEIEKFNKVSAEAPKVYDYYIGTKTAEGKYYVLNITKGSVVNTDDGTTITITGNEKH